VSVVHGTNENGPCDCGDVANCAEERDTLTKERFMKIHNMAPGDELRDQIAHKIGDAVCIWNAGEGAEGVPFEEWIAGNVMALVDPLLRGMSVSRGAESFHAQHSLSEERQRAERAEKKRDELFKMINDLTAQLIAERTRRLRAEKAIERVRKLHREEYGCCVACMGEASIPYPCDTITAMEGET
jgi:hypothetical protein